MATRLRLLLRSAAGGWQREVAVEFAYDKCQRRSAEAGFDFEACVAEMKAEPPYWSNLGLVDLDFGPAEAVDPNFQLLVDGWPRRVSLKAQLQARARAGRAVPRRAAARGSLHPCPLPLLCQQRQRVHRHGLGSGATGQMPQLLAEGGSTRRCGCTTPV